LSLLIQKIDPITGQQYAGAVAFDEVAYGVLSGVIILNFIASNITLSSPITAGVVPIGKTIYRCEVHVITAFDNAVIITVGDDVGNGSLMMTDEVDLTAIARYVSEPDINMIANTTFKIFRVSGSPTVGTAQIKIYYQ